MQRVQDFKAIRRPSFHPLRWRLGIGALQGIAYGALTLINAPGNSGITAPLLKLVVLVPLLLLLNVGRMRGRWLGLLIVAETLICVSTSLHQIRHGEWAELLAGLETIIFWLLVFIVQVMTFAADRDGRWMPRYATLFEVAWDQAILLALASLFTALAVGVLLLASLLFDIVGLPWVKVALLNTLVLHTIMGVMFAGAIALCIDAEAMVRGARRLVLSLFSFLLPITGWLAVAFLAALIVVPHTKSWKTHAAGWLLSLTATVLVLLLNALFQDGRDTQLPGKLMQVSGRVAAAVLLPVVVLALLPLGFRVAAHGWTVERVLAAALLGILTLYGVGYLVAAIRPGRWLAGIASTNIVVAALSAVVFLTLLTPVADPRRLAALDQISRLRDGTTSASAFPYNSLAHDDGPYGRLALQGLIEAPPSDHGTNIARDARDALAGNFRPPEVLSILGSYKQVTMHPQGATLPEDLKVAALKADFPYIGCLRSTGDRCEAVLLHPEADGVIRIAILDRLPEVDLLARAPGQSWRREKQLFLPAQCAAQRAALLEGRTGMGTMTEPTLILNGAQFRLDRPAPQCGD